MKRQNLVDTVQLDGFLRHSKNNTSGFILRNRDGSRLLHFQHSARAVVAHAGKDGTNGVVPGIAGG